MNKFFSVFKALFLLELRSKELFISVFTGLLLIICLLSVGISASFIDPYGVSKIFPVVFWLSVIVSSSVSLGRSFEADLKSGFLAVLLAARADLRAIFFCRSLISSLFMFLAVICGMGLQSVLMNYQIMPNFGRIVVAAFMLSLSISALGNLFSVLSSGSKIRSALLPLILLPCSFPIFFCAIELTFNALRQPETFFSGPWFLFSMVLAGVYNMLGLALFPAVVKANVSA